MSPKVELPDDVVPVVPLAVVHPLQAVTDRTWVSVGPATTIFWIVDYHRALCIMARTGHVPIVGCG